MWAPVFDACTGHCWPVGDIVTAASIPLYRHCAMPPIKAAWSPSASTAPQLLTYKQTISPATTANTIISYVQWSFPCILQYPLKKNIMRKCVCKNKMVMKQKRLSFFANSTLELLLVNTGTLISSYTRCKYL